MFELVWVQLQSSLRSSQFWCFCLIFLVFSVVLKLQWQIIHKLQMCHDLFSNSVCYSSAEHKKQICDVSFLSLNIKYLTLFPPKTNDQLSDLFATVAVGTLCVFYCTLKVFVKNCKKLKFGQKKSWRGVQGPWNIKEMTLVWIAQNWLSSSLLSTSWISNKNIQVLSLCRS